MLLVLLLGATVGAGCAIFAIENTASITVVFFGWHVTGPVALFMFSALVAGVLFALLLMLPRAIRESLSARYAKEERKTSQTTYTQETPLA